MNASVAAQLDHPSPNPVESRVAPRVRTLLRGRIVFNRTFSWPCQIRDLSETGARITFSDNHAIPDKFELHVDRTATIYSAEIVWRSRGMAGVRFCKAETHVSTQPESHADRTRHLEAKINLLQKRVAELTKRLTDLGQDVSFD